MRRAFLILGVALLAAQPVSGQMRPQPTTADGRVQAVEFVVDQVVLLDVAPGYQLSVEFAPDEQIESVAVGDSSAFQVTANRRGERLFVKVLRPGVTTNMTVVTDARTYLFDLTGSYSQSPGSAYIVRFVYSDLTGEPPEVAAPVIDRAYSLSGARSLRPSAIGDDGVHTYIEWPADRALPAVYALDDQGRETLVNGAMRDGRFVIDGVSERLMFRIDRQVARATRQPARGPNR